ncbi:unnamed protein product, partial [Iphiclides podalirius]
MDESGIDMGFDLASFLTNDYQVDHILDEMTAAQHQDFMYYELKSKAVPVTESPYTQMRINFTKAKALATLKTRLGKAPSFAMFMAIL